MINSSDFQSIIKNISTSLLVASPVYNQQGEISDFTIEYINDSFSRFTQDIVHTGENYGTFGHRLSSNIPWFEMAVKAASGEKESVDCDFYSELFKKWLRIVINGVTKQYIAITIIDINESKENEIRLEEQNKRLEELSRELTLSQANLNSQLEGIKTLNEQLIFAAYHDSMTNLYNRVWLTSEVKKCISQADENKTHFALLMLDIDDMKDINDSQGHLAGDSMIRRVAKILRKFETENIIPTRFGGDEFIILCKQIVDKDGVIALGRTLLDFFNSEGIGISCGISIFPDDTHDSDDILKFADMAKTEVKRNGKNNVVCFHSVMQEKFLRKLNIETKLSKAMADKVFQLYFQPQFKISDGKLRGFEALLRWHDDELGWISPEQFIPLAEETRLVIPLGDWVLETAIHTLSVWEKEFNFDGIMSVNVSPIQFKKADFLERLMEKINRYQITPSKLEVEITEGMLIDNVQETVFKLNKIKDMGIGISLDDFGTGYSSLRYLQILPLTTLKIDKSFVKNISAENGVEANITESIVNMVSKMGFDTIAEGVETEDQLEALKVINCNNVQGFLKGKPMPPDLCKRMLEGDESAILTVKNITPESL